MSIFEINISNQNFLTEKRQNANANISPASGKHSDILKYIAKNTPFDGGDGIPGGRTVEYYLHEGVGKRLGEDAPWNVYTPPELLRWQSMILRSDLGIGAIWAVDAISSRLEFDTRCIISLSDAWDFLEGMGIPPDAVLIETVYETQKVADRLSDDSKKRAPNWASGLCPNPDNLQEQE